MGFQLRRDEYSQSGTKEFTTATVNIGTSELSHEILDKIRRLSVAQNMAAAEIVRQMLIYCIQEVDPSWQPQN